MPRHLPAALGLSVALLLGLSAPAALAQEPAAGAQPAAGVQEESASDAPADPAGAQEDAADGQGETVAIATFTAEQADRGRAEYNRSCRDCHGENLDDGEFGGPPLKGLSFREKWFGMTADALFGYISTAMPPDRPGRLSDQVYADVTAYIISQNGVEAGTTELPSDPDALAEMMLPE